MLSWYWLFECLILLRDLLGPVFLINQSIPYQLLKPIQQQYPVLIFLYIHLRSSLCPLCLLSIRAISDVKVKQWKSMTGQKHLSGLPRLSQPGPGYTMQAQTTDPLAMKLIKLTEYTPWFIKVVWVNTDEFSQIWEKARSISFLLSIKNLWWNNV